MRKAAQAWQAVSGSIFKYIHQPTVIYLLAVLPVLATGVQAAPLEVMPTSVPPGAEIQFVVDEQASEGVFDLELRGDGFKVPIAAFDVDLRGQYIGIANVPLDLAAGQYSIDLVEDYGPDRVVRATVPILISSPLELDLTPQDSVAGETISINISGLTPGTLKVWVDDIVTIGPVTVGTSYSGEFRMPSGGAGSVWVNVANYVGRLQVGGTQVTLDRYVADSAVPTGLTFLQTDPLVPGETTMLTGSVRVPEGSFARDFEWTLAWETQSGALFPVNITPVEFEPQTESGGVVPFSTLMVLPGLYSGFPLVGFTNVDNLGFVYRNPETGSRGFVRSPSPVDYSEREPTTITGRVVTPSPTAGGDPIPLKDVIFQITAQSKLFESVETASQGVRASAAASTSTTSGMAALIHGNNQITTSFEEDINITAAGCPVTLHMGQTDVNGEFTMTFSTGLTDLLNELSDAPSPDINTSTGHGNRRDQFRIRLSGLHLGYGVPVLPGDTWSGIAYEFRRNESGSYSFRDSPTGDFDTNFFDPSEVLVSTMYPVPASSGPTKRSFNAYIPGLAPARYEDRGGTPTPIIRTVLTYPEYSHLADLPVDVRLSWPDWAEGELDAILKFNGKTVGAFSEAGGGRCGFEGTDYSTTVRGLANESYDSPIKARIEGGTSSGQYYEEFEIISEHGPTWFQDEAAYSGHVMSWKPNHLIITATEKEKKTEANAMNVGAEKDLGIGNMLNSNKMTGHVYQEHRGFAVVRKNHSRTATTVVSGASGSRDDSAINSVQLPVTGTTALSYVKDTGMAAPLASTGNVRDELYSRLQEMDPDIGSAVAQVIIDTGRIPIFRYMWGVSPIAGATLGADIWFKVLLWYFGWLNEGATSIDLDMVVEPQTQVGLDVFFDFSALFGFVNAAVTASPAIGIGMPVIIYNNLLDTNASKPCFEFVLDIAFEVAVGACPVCVSASHTENLLSESTPDSCTVFAGTSNQALNAVSAANPPPPSDSISLSGNGAGTAFLVSAGVDGIYARKLVGEKEREEYLIPSTPGATRPDATFYDLNRAVAVWSKSALGETQFAALVAQDFTGENTYRFNGTVDQHMVYSLWDGSTWSSPNQLTAPNTGEGGVKLAACPAGTPGCPADGEVLAVWHRDIAGDIDQGQIHLYYAFFDGFGWTIPQPLDEGFTAKDVQPAPFYLEGEPGVVWVRNPSADARDPDSGSQGLDQRRLAYRFLREPGGIHDVPGSPRNVASPSIDVFADGTLGIAFTSSADNEPFIGSRRELYVATASSCSGGICEWNSYPQQDQHHRKIYAEHPVMVVDNRDRAVIAFRQLGVSGDLRPDDPVGLQGFGDLVKVEFVLPDLEVGPERFTQALTVDGAVNWQTQAIFDPTMNSMIMANTKGAAVGQFRHVESTAQSAAGLASTSLSANGSIVAYSLPHLPDLAITGLDVGDEVLIQGAKALRVTVEVANQAASLDENGGSAVLGLWWDGPPGVGTQAGTALNMAISGGGFHEVTLDVPIPAGFGPDETHQLFAVVNYDRMIEEGDFNNNTWEATYNQLPTPQNVMPSVNLDGTMVLLDWDPAQDPRVTGWRIYRRHTVTLETFSAGFTPVNGFADLNVVPGEEYEYQVTAMTAGLLESEPTKWVRVEVKRTVGDEMFTDGFETR